MSSRVYIFTINETNLLKTVVVFIFFNFFTQLYRTDYFKEIGKAIVRVCTKQYVQCRLRSTSDRRLPCQENRIG